MRVYRNKPRALGAFGKRNLVSNMLMLTFNLPERGQDLIRYSRQLYEESTSTVLIFQVRKLIPKVTRGE